MGAVIRHSLLRTAMLSTAILLMLSTPLKAQENKLQLQEQTIKAGLVYNFLKYTTWPDGFSPIDKGRLRVCFFGGESLDGNLAPLDGRTAQQSVISISRVDDIGKTADCSLLFINRSKGGNLPELLSFLRGKHVLTVSDMDKFASLGGMVELATENKRVTLYINKKAVDDAGLDIQGRLMKLAKLISG